MAYNGDKGSLKKSFVHAFNGIKIAITTERNMKIHLIATIIVIAVGIYFRISELEWSLLIVTISLVLCLEIVNTAIEALVDLVTESYHPMAKKAKDLAAGAVLVASFAAFVIGLFIFLPYFCKIF
jgi:undecaprenol kinase